MSFSKISPLAASQSKPLDRRAMEMMIPLLMAENSSQDHPKIRTLSDFVGVFPGAIKDENEVPPPLTIVLKRIEVLNLPITFTPESMMAFIIFPDRVGAVVVMLIDLLEAFEDEQVTLEKICRMYPMGFYNEEALEERIDFLKEDRCLPEDKRRCKFSSVY